MEKLIKILLIILLLGCLFDMNYSYYTSIRFISLIAFLFFAYNANNKNQNGLKISFLILALLFQPFFKIPLGRNLWNIIDITVSIFLIATLLLDSKNKNSINLKK